MLPIRSAVGGSTIEPRIPTSHCGGKKPVLKLMFGAMMRAAERRRAIKITDFERRQMEAVRQELDHEYEARNGLVSKASADADQTKLSSTSRT